MVGQSSVKQLLTTHRSGRFRESCREQHICVNVFAIILYWISGSCWSSLLLCLQHKRPRPSLWEESERSRERFKYTNTDWTTWSNIRFTSITLNITALVLLSSFQYTHIKLWGLKAAVVTSDLISDLWSHVSESDLKSLHHHCVHSPFK